MFCKINFILPNIYFTNLYSTCCFEEAVAVVEPVEALGVLAHLCFQELDFKLPAVLRRLWRLGGFGGCESPCTPLRPGS